MHINLISAELEIKTHTISADFAKKNNYLLIYKSYIEYQVAN